MPESGGQSKHDSAPDDLRSEIEALSGVGELFKILSDDTRSKLLFALGRRELCVREMACLLDLSLPAVSHHLRILHHQRLVRKRRAGKEVFYSLRDRRVIALIVAAVLHAEELGLLTSLEPAMI
ncbi:MAG: metalloregulator ArsR/SmtB family transcription factor [bacterium]|jgi:DNA-binding transcriptional ArsR family regulator|nr:winged helix-turn-helix transcriptional regulator [Bacillota bacterium]